MNRSGSMTIRFSGSVEDLDKERVDMPEEVVITSKDIIMALSRGQNRISIRSLECSSSGANTLSNGFKIFFGDAAIAKN